MLGFHCSQFQVKFFCITPAMDEEILVFAGNEGSARDPNRWILMLLEGLLIRLLQFPGRSMWNTWFVWEQIL